MNLTELKNKLSGKHIKEQFKLLIDMFPGNVIFTTSFGIEDQVITQHIFENDLPVEVVTLDTGRLFMETYKVFSETLQKYKKQIKVFFPYHEPVEAMVTEKGPFSFYESRGNRMECCRIRKVIPLRRALQGKKVWISGIRADQSDNRKLMDWIEIDEDQNLIKFYPLFNWSYEEVQEYVSKNSIPYNLLHNKGFVSIGCEPCTRAVKPGEDFRSGRWWWENDGPKECGCHIK